MTQQSSEKRKSMHPRFRHFFDQNALSLWFIGAGLLGSMMTLPVFV